VPALKCFPSFFRTSGACVAFPFFEIVFSMDESSKFSSRRDFLGMGIPVLGGGAVSVAAPDANSGSRC